MKIYNKSGFGWGIFLTAIGLAMLATSIWTGFDVKGTILMAACLVLGATFLGRSLSHAMSREDKLAELDERNRPWGCWGRRSAPPSPSPSASCT